MYKNRAPEIPIDQFMGKKMRITTLTQMRNGIPSLAPGDKHYKNPECTTGFFKDGAQTGGNAGRRIPDFYETIDLSIKSLDPNKLWKNKVKQEELSFQTNMVKDLDTWEETVLKDKLPNLDKVPEVAPKAADKSKAKKK